MTIQANFDSGNKIQFFNAFHDLVPMDFRKKDFTYKKLEFYLQIYFVVYIKHPNIVKQSQDKSSDNEFK